MKRLPLATAGLASVISPSGFLPSSLNSGPAWITNVSPSSLTAKILPLYDLADDERRRIGRGQRRMRPDNEAVAPLLTLQRDVAGRSRPDRICRPQRVLEVAGADEQQAMARERCDGVNRRHAAHLPEQLAARVVRSHLLAACRDDLSTHIVVPHERRRPVRFFALAIGSPQLAPGAR